MTERWDEDLTEEVQDVSIQSDFTIPIGEIFIFYSDRFCANNRILAEEDFASLRKISTTTHLVA